MINLRGMVFLLIIVIGFTLYSDKVKFNDSWGPQGFSLSKSATSGISITYSVNEFSMTKTEINKEMMTTVQLTGVFLQNDEGAPDLPGSSRYIAIPQGSTVKFVVSEMQKEIYQNIDMAPAPKIPWDSDRTPMEFKKNVEIYSKDVFYPSSPVIMSEPSKIRGLDVVMLGITPFQYNPVTKELIVYRDMKVDVTFEGGNGHFGEDRLRNSQWDRILKNTVINNTALADVVYKKASDSKADEFEYIIICPDNATFINYANQLKDFRTKQGIKTGVVTTTQIGGNTEAAIETYINNAYNNWDIPPSAVLMMADYGASGTTGTLFAPTYTPTTYPCVSDNFYADVITTDGKALPEITFARMTAQNETHLQTMVSKIISYETNPPTSVNFYKNPVTALGWQTERWFQICSESVGGFMKNLLGKTPVRINEVYEGNPTVDPWSSATNTSQVTDYFGPSGRGYIPSTPQELGAWTGGDATDVANALNSGAFLLMHRDHGFTGGWGEPDFVSADIDLLTNTGLTFIFSMNCLSGKYNEPTEVFAEKFHRYKYNGSNSGALGVVVASETSYSFVNDAYTWGTFDYMWPNYMTDYGAAPTANDEFMPAFASVSGKYFLDYSSWPYNTANKIDTNYLFHMFGDPYQVVYTEVPQNLTISHNDLIDGEPTFYVTADAGSVIALVVNGEIIGTGTGTGSLQAISIEPQFSSTQVILTVTKQNYYRYENTFTVQQPSGNSGGTYSQSVNSLDFGNLTLGNNTSKQFSITNSHSSEYITGQITAPAGYTVSAFSKSSEETSGKESKNVISYTVPANTTRTYNLKFEPASAGSYNGNITVTSSDPVHTTQYITLTGACVVPDINLNPVSLTPTTGPESSTNKLFYVENTDLGQLDYSLSVNYTDTKEFKGSGGPDTFGYKWKDSDETGGPVYNWVEISSLGTVVTLTDDSESGAINMGMSFTFYGTDYTTVVIGDNGALTFTGTDIASTNPTIPSTAASNAVIAPFWDDLNCGSTSSGDVFYYYDAVNTRFIVEYNAIVNYSGTNPNTFQVILYGSGKIVFQYKTMSGTINSCTVGIENQTGTVGSLVAYNTTYIKNNLAIQFQATPEWLTLSSTSGTINGAGNSQITATCSSEGLELGIYTAEIIIGSNDPDEAIKTLPVTFTVAENLGGTFSMNLSSLAYGTVTAGKNSTKTFQIANSHETQTISGTITTITAYTVSIATKDESKDLKNVLNYTVGPNSSKTFNLLFEPVAEQTYNGNITITSSDTGHATEYIAITGAGAVPEIDINPVSVSASASPGASSVKNFMINNTGSGELDYSISINYIDGKYVKGSGGPDAYGYKWTDSDETGGPVFSWVDISTVGTAIALSDDGESSAINLGMTFNLYGVDYTSLVIGANGAITFNGSDISYTNAAIPATATPQAIVAPFWDDLNPGSANNIFYYYDSANSRFVVSYVGVVTYGTSNGNTFQIILNASGKILFQYGAMNGTLTSCTVGIENGAGTIGTQVIYNAAYLKSNFAIQFQATPEWLTLNDTSGTILASGNKSITATCSAADLGYGTYTADVTITSNDTDEPSKVIPVTFIVSDVVTPGVPSNVITSVVGTNLVVDWNVSADATSYDVYSSDSPYGTFAFETNVATNQYIVAYTASRKFYYIIAKNATK